MGQIIVPISYKISPDQGLMSVYYSGGLTMVDILELRKYGAADSDFNPSFHVIDDISKVTSTSIDYGSINQLSAHSMVRPGVKRALVAVTDLQLGMANMYRVLSESAGQHFKIFNDYKSAVKWVLSTDKDD